MSVEQSATKCVTAPSSLRNFTVQVAIFPLIRYAPQSGSQASKRKGTLRAMAPALCSRATFAAREAGAAGQQQRAFERTGGFLADANQKRWPFADCRTPVTWIGV
jgi:hypothetical protein